MTAQPKPTAADVLNGHPGMEYVIPRYFGTAGYRCTGCRQSISSPGQHQADMLAAAGLLATAEHDAQVAAQALREAAAAWQTGGWAGDLPRGSTRHAVVLGMAQNATDWLRARADRIAGGAT